jgi:hypothetical protein
MFSDDDKSDHGGGGGRKPQPPKQDVPPVVDPTNRYVDMTIFTYIMLDFDYPLPETLLELG